MSHRTRCLLCPLNTSSDAFRALVLHRPRNRPRQLNPPSKRHASSSPSSAVKAPRPSKPIVLEKPDKFRPPSHPSRLNARRTPRHYPGPPIPPAEKEAQATRSYPHTFPRKGSSMYWFLTNKTVHLYISLGTLTLLSVITITQNFLHTSPYSHLVPAISTMPVQPLTYVSDWFHVVRLHQQYNTEKTAEARSQGIADAQKRRLWRRAHGLEDVEADEGEGVKSKKGKRSGARTVSGVDVRGLVNWDDGLSGAERQEMRRRKAAREKERDPRNGDGGAAAAADTDTDTNAQSQPQSQTRRPLKKWLGIW